MAGTSALIPTMASDDEKSVSRTTSLLVPRSFSIPILIIYILWLIFLWFLPFWSYYFNDHLEYFNQQWAPNGVTGPNNYLCMTPPELMHCSDGSDFSELPVIKRRMSISGRRDVGCGCSQGVIGESACPQDGILGYTLSSLIAAMPAAAAFGGGNVPAQLSMWWLALVVVRRAKPNIILKYLLFAALLGFNISFTAFGLASDCIFLSVHLLTTKLYLFATLCYNVILLVIALFHGDFTSNLRLLLAFSIVVSIFFVVAQSTIMLGFQQAMALLTLSPYYTFFGYEVSLLTVLFSPAVLLLVFGELPVN